MDDIAKMSLAEIVLTHVVSPRDALIAPAGHYRPLF